MPQPALAALVIVGFIAWLTPSVICVLKGKYFLAALGLPLAFLIHTIALSGAIRLAKPNSWWARHYYAGEKLARSWERFTEITLDSLPPHPQDSSWDGVDYDPNELDPITRRALKKSGRL